MPSPVSIQIQRMEIPTYVLGPDCPYPVFPWRSARGYYPYATRTDITTTKRPVSHQTVVLENEYVRAVVLPDLGGHLYSLFDKVAGRDVFMVGPSVKYQNISMRGAWIAGGVEFNFGHRGHNVTTVNTVSWTTRQEADGSASVWVGAMVRPLEQRWAVRISLRPQRAALDLDIHTMAPLALPGLMYWWTNAAVEVGVNSRFYYFGMGADGHTIHSWPLTDGLDYSWYRNRLFGSDMFLMQPQRDYMGFYDFDRRHGLAQTADRVLAPGQKYFTWGTDQRGRYWDLLLSDSSQTYCEIQRGRLPTQGHTEPIPPMSCDRHSETWMPLNQTEGLSGTENDLIVSVTDDGEGTTTVRLVTLVPRRSLRVEAFSETGSLGCWTLENPPVNEPAAHELSLPAGQSVRRVRVTDAAGTTLMDWEAFDPNQDDWSKSHPEFNEAAASLEELFAQAQRRRFEWWPYDITWPPDVRRRKGSSGLYEKVLQRDPGHSGALRALAEVDFFNGRLESALERIVAAQKRQPADPDIRTLHGWILLALDRPDEAAEHFTYATRYEPGRRNGTIGLVSALLKAGRWSKALTAAEALLAELPADKWARVLAVTALRKAGQVDRARQILTDLLSDDPLWARATAEALLLGVPTNLAAGQRRLADDSVTAAVPYIELGLWEDAKAILEVDESDEPFSPAVRLAHLAYVLHRLGDSAGVQAVLRQIRQAPLENANPWSTASVQVFETLTRAYPGEPMLRLMWGNLLGSRTRVEEALAEWLAAAELGLEHAIVQHNIAATQAALDQRDEALASYRKAWTLSGKDIYLFVEFDRFLAGLGRHEEREVIHRQLSAEAQDRSMVALRRVPQLLDLERYDAALEELATRTFLAGEQAERVVRRYYLEALLGKAVDLMNEGAWTSAQEVLRKGFEYPRNHNSGRQYSYPDEAMVNYMLGIAAEALGDSAAAEKHWIAAASENHYDGAVTQAYEMLAWLALGQRQRAMVLAHKMEALARGETRPYWQFYMYNSPSVLQLDHALGQLAKGRPHEAQTMWRQTLAAEPDARWFRPHIRMSEALLARMCRKVTGAAQTCDTGGRCCAAAKANGGASGQRKD